MIDELLHYYNGELAYLRELGAEFAAEVPQGGRPAAAGGGQVRGPARRAPARRGRVPDGADSPQDRRRVSRDHRLAAGHPLPALSAPAPFDVDRPVRAQPGAGEADDGFTIERGSRLNSRPVDGVPCRFRTTYPVTLWPIEVEAARLDPDRVVVPGKPPEAVALLQLTLSGLGGVHVLAAQDRSASLLPRRVRPAALQPLRALAQ